MSRSLTFPALAIIGAIGWLMTVYWDAHTALLAYLSILLPFIEIALGALFVLLLGHLVPGRWFEVLRIPLAATSLTLPVLGLLFLPIMFGLPALYSWAAEPSQLHGFKAIYLSPPAFILRVIFYFCIWSFIAMRSVQASNGQRTASWGLVVYALTGSLAGVDWVESLTPEFHSSVFGLLFLSSQVLAGLSFTLAVFPLIYKDERPLTLHGQLLISCILLWGYLHGMQYIIIWAANKPDEVKWYLDRSTGGSAVVTWFVYLSQFVLPFLAFLLARVRQSIEAITVIAASFLAIRVVESFWLVLPGQHFDLYALLPATVFAFLFCASVFWMAFAGALADQRHGRSRLKLFSFGRKSAAG
jgi:hypothetical protein